MATGSASHIVKTPTSTLQQPEHRCPFCSRTFFRPEHLTRHQRTHTKEKPFSCEVCTKSFSRLDLLRRHEAKSHDGEFRAQGARPMRRAKRMPEQTTARLPSPAATASLQWPIDQGATTASSQVGSTLDGVATEPDLWSTIPSIETSSIEIDGTAMFQETLQPLDPNFQTLFFPCDMSWLDGLNDPLCKLFDTGLSQDTELLGFDNKNTSLLSTTGFPEASDLNDDYKRRQKPSPLRTFTVTADERQTLQLKLQQFSHFALPSRAALSRYVAMYFQQFNQHMPFIHEASWKADGTPLPVFLAMCANGAVYCLEDMVARRLYDASLELLKPLDTGLWTLQTSMLLMAFGAWSGEPTRLQQALHIQGGLLLRLRQAWYEHQKVQPQLPPTWEQWIAAESLRRVAVCLFILSNLIDVAYDTPSPISPDAMQDLPCPEHEWRAQTEQEWIALFLVAEPREWRSVNAVLQQVRIENTSVPLGIGTFACHVVIHALNREISMFRRASLCGSDSTDHQTSSPVFEWHAIRRDYEVALRRWQVMWENEPESSLSPTNPCGPIAFNSTAQLRLAYARLNVDFRPVRRAFSLGFSPAEIADTMASVFPVQRSPSATKAVLHACLALRVPVSIGLNVVARTGFWVWSVQHSLCYFECALLLSMWLQAISECKNLTEEERRVLKLITDIMAETETAEQNAGRLTMNLASGVLRSWAYLFDTSGTTVWKCMPKMAQVLRICADRL